MLKRLWNSRLGPVIYCLIVMPLFVVGVGVGLTWVALASSVRYGFEKLCVWVRDRA
jgi:hypothetical protein